MRLSRRTPSLLLHCRPMFRPLAMPGFFGGCVCPQEGIKETAPQPESAVQGHKRIDLWKAEEPVIIFKCRMPANLGT